ncbi:glycosylhydrolase-like jelly roll fold domain-containing protein, partial [Candidatus Poribacteria bacterium]
LTDSEQVCDTGILAHHNHLPWEPAKVLFQNQWDFNYIEDRLLTEAALEDGRLRFGESSYSIIVRMAGQSLPESGEKVLEQFAQSGGQIILFDPSGDSDEFLEQMEGFLAPDIVLQPANPDLRYIHVRKDGREFYYLTNEGGDTIEGKLTARSVGHAEWWDPLTGESSSSPVLTKPENSICVPLRLERRQGMVLAIDPERGPILELGGKLTEVARTIDVSTGWRLLHPDTGKLLASDLVDWNILDGYDKFSGTLVYEKTLDTTSQMLDDGKWTLNLGEVHDFAEVFCNDVPCGVELWGPFRFGLALKSGANTLWVAVTNSMANRMGNASLPSGMTGPVTLEK